MHHCKNKRFYFPYKAAAVSIALMAFWIAPLFGQFTITVDPDSLAAICGTNKVKLVFLAKDSLWYVDFSETTPQARTIKTISGAPTTPALSPDGGYAAYVTGIGGVPPVSMFSPNSVPWLCDLSGATAPRKVADTGWAPRFDLASAAPRVVYATCGKLVSDTADLWNGCGKMRAWSSSSGQSSDVWAGGSWFGGMSYNGQWLCTADNGPAYMLDITNAANKPVTLHRLHWTNGKTNADTVFALQACNPSISSSRAFPDAMMYLDVGNLSMPGYHTKNMGYWDFHTRIFISRSTGAVAKYYDMPFVADFQNSGDVSTQTWESPRWSNHPYFASAALYKERSWAGNKVTDRNESIYLINLKDSTYLKLITLSDTSVGNTLSMEFPWLWVDVAQDFASQEDKQWLSGSLDAAVRKPLGGSGNVSSYRIYQSHGNLFSGRPLAGVEFFTLQGERIGKFNAYRKIEFKIPSMALENGECFAKCTFTDNKTGVIKLINLKM